MRRQLIPELLDSDSGTPDEIAGSLRDLRWVNRYFGGLSTTASLLQKIAHELNYPHVLSYLDVAGASADGPARCAHVLRSSGTELRTTVLDRSPTHFGFNGIPNAFTNVCGDALALPFASGSFDVVGTSLFLHHLEPEEVISFLRNALDVCRSAVVINDLERNWLHYSLAMAGRPLYRSRITRHDAPASVLRAYTKAEMRSLLTQTPAARIEISRHYLFRIGAVIWK
jgi:hypothetical protein